MEKTINEARADYGLPPIDNGDAVMITTSMKADSPSRYLIDTTDGTACSHPSRQQAMRDYEHSVIRCRDGRPAISFVSWCHWAGINPWEL